MIGWSCSRFSQRLNLPGRPGRTARESAPACLRLSRLFPRPARRQWRVRWPCSGTRQRRPCRLRKTLRRWLFQCFAGKVRKCWRLKHNPRRAPSGVGQPGVWGNQGRFLSCLFCVGQPGAFFELSQNLFELSGSNHFATSSENISWLRPWIQPLRSANCTSYGIPSHATHGVNWSDT